MPWRPIVIGPMALLSLLPLAFSIIFLPVLGTSGSATPTPTASPTDTPTPEPTPTPPPSLEPTPFFRFPVVDGAEVSALFDHDPAVGVVAFYDGRRNHPAGSFYFHCPEIGGASVGCEMPAADQTSCPNEAELWYDNHHGVDFEYAPDWRTGDACDLGRFAGVYRDVYAPAPGRVTYVGYDAYNGHYIVINHDLNGDGDHLNDGFRSYYLHFADGGIAVYPGQIVNTGDLLGTGGMTGLSWTPHLHFEVHRFLDGAWRPVDPFGWWTEDADPWPYPNHPLWRGALVP